MFTKLLKLNLIILLSIFFFASCQKENLDTPDTPPVIENPVTPPIGNLNPAQALMSMSMSSSSSSTGCYELGFPITFILEDSSTVTANAIEDLNTIFSGNVMPVDIAYPVNLVDPLTGQTVMANDETELMTLLADCDQFTSNPSDPTWCDSTNVFLGSIGCYELEYPVSFVLQDGSTATAQSVDDLEGIFTSNNPVVNFAYPLNLVNLLDGTTATANSEEELGTLLATCDGFITNPPTIDTTLINIGGGFFGCYELQYPVSLLLQDGTTATANSENDFFTIFTSVTNPAVDFVYPINLIHIVDGTIETANSQDDVNTIISGCVGTPPNPPTIDTTIITGLFNLSPCYDIVYPLSFVMQDGTIETAQSLNDVLGIFTSPNNPPVDFEYPVNLLDLVNGTTVTANSETELNDLFDACTLTGGGGTGGSFGVVFDLTCVSVASNNPTQPVCYSYNYPISLLLHDGSTATVNDDNELMNHIFNASDFVYPISLTDNTTGATLTVNDENDALNLIANCN